jgi:putative heme-binding domain-containing protein
MNRSPLLLALAFTSLSAPLFAAEAPLTPAAEILKKVTFPPEFEATVFASPPQVSYPVFISAAPDGTLFVACDENGSLDRKPDRGKVVMCKDTDGDGQADVFTTFAKMDSPRGVIWDASTRTLFCMHPPDLTAYTDADGDGVAEKQVDLITGLGFGLDFRGADHTTNGCRMGIDGWIYIAVGDYGAVQAKGKDGRTLALKGGGIVRVRPDGSGMELVVRGARNILAVAVSPTLDLFTRDNTNDGGGWNIRLSHNPVGAQMGYPSLYKNFADEMIPTMADLGGGSPMGSIFLDEPAVPEPWGRGFYSVEWGANKIELHPLTQNGATWKVEPKEFKQFMKMTRGTDLDVDGSGRLYASSWDGASFTYAGPKVGYIIRLTPKGKKVEAFPDLKKMSEAELQQGIGSPSAVMRMACQREMLARGVLTGGRALGWLSDVLEKSQNEKKPSLGAQVAAIFTLKQLSGSRVTPYLVELATRDDLREYALKALADDQRIAAAIPTERFLTALTDPNPRVRLQAVTGLGRLGKVETADRILPLTADSDYTVAHVAVQMLVSLKAADVCLRALDSADPKLQPGALRVLGALHELAAVQGLLDRLPKAKGELQRGIYRALCRVNFDEAPYTDPKMWWGTRPDTSGPIFKVVPWAETEKIQAALKQQLEAAQSEDAAFFVSTLTKHKISFPGLDELMISKVGKDTASRLDLIGPLLGGKGTPPEPALKALVNVALSKTEPAELRARALRMLAGVAEKNVGAVTEVFVKLPAADHTGTVGAVWEEFTRDARHAKQVGVFAKLARDKDPAKRVLGATVLVNLTTSNVVKDANAKAAAAKEIETLWTDPEQAATLLGVIGATGAKQFGPQVREHLHDKSSVVAEAAEFALTKLGLDKVSAPGARTIGEMKYEDVVKTALAVKGDATRGKALFLQQACTACHTVSESEPPKGPMLGGIATRYTRAELCESILKPGAKVSQGFETVWFKLKNKDEVEGFVVKESGDSVEVRNIAGVTAVLEKGNIVERQKREKSMMPDGLLNALTPEDLAAMLAYLEGTKAGK